MQIAHFPDLILFHENLGLVPMDFFRRRRKSILLLAAATSLSVYGAYRIYHHPSVFRQRRQMSNLAGAIFSLADAVSFTSDAASLISADLTRFLCSDSDEIPPSLKQLSKIAASDELAGSISRVFEALTVGIARGIRSRDGNDSDELRPAVGLSDRVLDKLFSSAGSGFASVVLGSFARNLVIGFYSSVADGGGSPISPAGPGWVDVVCSSEKSRELIADSIQVFVGTTVAVFLDKTMHINSYDEFFAGLTNPRHEARVKDMLVSVCNGAMETLVRTSHRVLTASSPASWTNRIERLNLEIDRKSSFDYKSRESNGWVSQVSSTLAVPSNRKFVLDVTGRMTLETVRSVFDFTMWKVSDGISRGKVAIRQEFYERGLELLRYVSARSIVITTICFVLCQHVYAGTRCLMQV